MVNALRPMATPGEVHGLDDVLPTLSVDPMHHIDAKIDAQTEQHRQDGNIHKIELPPAQRKEASGPQGPAADRQEGQPDTRQVAKLQGHQPDNPGGRQQRHAAKIGTDTGR